MPRKTKRACSHAEVHELQSHADFLKLSRWTRSAQSDLDDVEGMTARVAFTRASRHQNQTRAARLLRTTGNGWDGGVMPAPRPIVEHKLGTGYSGEMVSSTLRMRSATEKWERASLYLTPPREKQARTEGTSRPRAQANEAELAALMEELGL